MYKAHLVKPLLLEERKVEERRFPFENRHMVSNYTFQKWRWLEELADGVEKGACGLTVDLNT